MTTDPAVLFFEAVADQLAAQMESYTRARIPGRYMGELSESSWKPHVAKAIFALNQGHGSALIDAWEQPLTEDPQNRREKVDLELYLYGERWGVEMKCLTAGGGHWIDAHRLLLSNKKYNRRFLLLAGPTTGAFKSVRDAQQHLLKTEHWKATVEGDKAGGDYKQVDAAWRERNQDPPRISAVLHGERPIGSSAAVGLIEITI